MEIVRLVSAVVFLVAISEAGRLSCGNQQDTVEAHSGDAVHLPCPFTWVGEDPSEYMVVWQLTRGENLTVVHDRENHVENTEQDPRFRDRTGLGPDWFTEGNATLSIRKLDLGDGGMYTCLITTMNPYSRAMCAETTVSVQEGAGGSDAGNDRSEPDGRNHQQNQGNSTTATEPEQIAGHNPDPGQMSRELGGRSSKRSRSYLLVALAPTLLFLVICTC
ncbi:V-set domain-containing T-cell activation inhibitor 1-like [Heptranchias perlo]|uniref:V-set domain-containing T-cell activation inhibitor 1-like n=1 Tax=Heptranchias perlo TaxID=212740 RepID=UPI003559534F